MSADLTDLLGSSADTASADGATPVSELPEMPASPVVPDEPRDEVERLDPDPTGPVVLESGIKVEIVPLKLRETMKLLKIVTRGAGSVLESTIGQLDMDDPAAFAQTFGALILFSIPEAENEAVEFIQSMVLPYGYKDLTQTEKIDQLNALAAEMGNPELGDVISVIERVVRRESEDIRSLGKRISQAFQLTNRPQDHLPATS